MPLYGKGGWIRTLRTKSPKGNVKAKFGVAYLAPYAVYVHERLDVFHPNGEAKFVETPARVYRKQILAIIARTFLQKRSTRDAALAAVRFLFDRSQELVPVDTGLLRRSGTIVENPR